MKLFFVAAAIATASVLATTGCVVETSSPQPTPVVDTTEPDGVATIDWTIEGTKDPNLCALSDATDIVITVTTSGGGDAGTYRQSCDAFATAITLAPGSYYADALLVDGAGNARTTSVPIDDFTILGDDNLDIPIDFPASSFF